MPVEHRLVVSRLCQHIVRELHHTWGRYATLAECEDGLNRQFAAEIARQQARRDREILLDRATIRLSLDERRRIKIDVEAYVRSTSLLADPMKWTESLRVTLPI
jgi:hypothetical protein